MGVHVGRTRIFVKQTNNMTRTTTSPRPRYEAKKVTGIKFKHPQGYTLGKGFGVYDNLIGKWVADEGAAHAWEYPTKRVAADIADQFNRLGPAGELTYAVTL